MALIGGVFSILIEVIIGIFGANFLAALIIAIVMTVKKHKVPMIILYIVAGISLAIGIVLLIMFKSAL